MQKQINELNNFLDLFKNEGIVIGLDGYSGSGKTTLVNELKKQRNDILFVHMDDYVSWFLDLQNAQKNKELKIAFDKPEKLQELRNFIREQKGKNTVLLEGIFLLHGSVLGDLIDKFVFIDSDLNLAEQRREKREREIWGEKYIHSDNPKSFAGGFYVEYKRYLKQYRPLDKADILLFHSDE